MVATIQCRVYLCYHAAVSCKHAATIHMIRTQIQLTDDQAQALKALSAKTGLSIAEVIRRGLVPLMRGGLAEQDDRARRAAAVAGRFHSEKTDVSVDHDRYLADV